MAAPAPEGLTGWGKAVSTIQNKASATKMFDRFAATVPDTPVSGTTLAAITLEQAVDERTWTNLADFVTKQRKNAKGEQYANTTMRNLRYEYVDHSRDESNHHVSRARRVHTCLRRYD